MTDRRTNPDAAPCDCPGECGHSRHESIPPDVQSQVNDIHSKLVALRVNVEELTAARDAGCMTDDGWSATLDGAVAELDRLEGQLVDLDRQATACDGDGPLSMMIDYIVSHVAKGAADV